MGNLSQHGRDSNPQKSASVANNTQQKVDSSASSQFKDNRTQSVTQRKLQDVARKSDRVQQQMKIRNTDKASEISNATRNKHVVATGEQEATAKAAYSSSTFVTSSALLTNAIDSNDHNFTEDADKPSGRKDIDADVVIYQWNKKDGVGIGNDVEKTIDGVSTSCEIGAKKGGDDKIKITHFMKK